MTDLCKAGLWDIDPRATCPVCGALPDTDCEAVRRIEWCRKHGFDPFDSVAHGGVEAWKLVTKQEIAEALMRAHFRVLILDAMRGWVGSSDDDDLIAMSEQQIADWHRIEDIQEEERQTFLRRVFRG